MTLGTEPHTVTGYKRASGPRTALPCPETSFFGDTGGAFRALRTHLVPAAIERNAERRRLAVWSAGAATGEELYSIAMVLEAHFPDLADWDVVLYGSDVSDTALRRARLGEYSAADVARGVPAPMLERYFDEQPDGYVVAERLRRRCFFEHVDLEEAWPALPVFDIVFCRNLLFGLAEESRQDVLARLRRRLAVGGHLVLGPDETALGLADGYAAQRVGDTVVFRHDG